jgi:hypothetical protein
MMSRRNNKKKRGKQEPPPQIQEVATPAAQDRAHPWVLAGKALFLLSGWMVSLFLGLLDLPAKIVSFTSNAPKASEAISSWAWNYKSFEGRFSSDQSAWKERNLIGSEEPQSDAGEIQLDIGYDGSGRFSGEIVSSRMEQGVFPWSRVMVDGKVGVTGEFTGEVWDIVGNQRAVYSSFKLQIEDARLGSLRLIPLRKDDGVFEGEVVLWPTDFQMAGGNRGKGYQKLLDQSWERFKKERGERSASANAPK